MAHNEFCPKADLPPHIFDTGTVCICDNINKAIQKYLTNTLEKNNA